MDKPHCTELVPDMHDLKEKCPHGHPAGHGAQHHGAQAGHPHANRFLEDGVTPKCRLIAWEVTRSCNLACKHCRAEAHPEPYEGELSTAEAKKLIDSFKEVGDPIIIFTGGDPMIRPDVYELAAYAREKGLRCVMSPNGTLINEKNVLQIKEAGFARCSISIDGHDAKSHDAFRGVQGAFDAVNSASALALLHGIFSCWCPWAERQA